MERASRRLRRLTGGPALPHGRLFLSAATAAPRARLATAGRAPIAFAKSYPKFQEINYDLLGLSIDSNYAHLAWIRNIKEKFDVEIPFPVIEDLTMKVRRRTG